MSSKQCPLCGNEIEEDNEKFCSDCRSINEQHGAFSRSVFSESQPVEGKAIDALDREEAIQNLQESNTAVVATNLKKPKKAKVWAIVVSVLVLSGIATGGYFFLQSQSQNDREELAFWNNSLKINTSKSYMDYINRYPDGKYIKDAQDNILRYNESLRKFWDSIKQHGSEDEIISFLKKYPQTPYYKEATGILDSIAWINVLKLNTQESYKSYLHRTEKKELNGTYQTLAQEKYNYFAQMEFVGGDEWKNVENVLAVFFRQLSSKSYASLKMLFAQTVKRFYTMKDVSPDGIIASIKNEILKDDIATMQIVPDTEQMQVKRDNKGYYIINLTAQKNINYNKSKEKSEVRSQFIIVLDSAMKVVELNELKGRHD
jgi:hypothetical protein